MADLDPRQVRGELGTAGLAGAYLLIAQRGRFELGLDADRFGDVERASISLKSSTCPAATLKRSRLGPRCWP